MLNLVDRHSGTATLSPPSKPSLILPNNWHHSPALRDLTADEQHSSPKTVSTADSPLAATPTTPLRRSARRAGRNATPQETNKAPSPKPTRARKSKSDQNASDDDDDDEANDAEEPLQEEPPAGTPSRHSTPLSDLSDAPDKDLSRSLIEDTEDPETTGEAAPDFIEAGGDENENEEGGRARSTSPVAKVNMEEGVSGDVEEPENSEDLEANEGAPTTADPSPETQLATNDDPMDSSSPFDPQTQSPSTAPDAQPPPTDGEQGSVPPAEFSTSDHQEQSRPPGDTSDPSASEPGLGPIPSTSDPPKRPSTPPPYIRSPATFNTPTINGITTTPGAEGAPSPSSSERPTSSASSKPSDLRVAAVLEINFELMRLYMELQKQGLLMTDKRITEVQIRLKNNLGWLASIVDKSRNSSPLQPTPHVDVPPLDGPSAAQLPSFERLRSLYVDMPRLFAKDISRLHQYRHAHTIPSVTSQSPHVHAPGSQVPGTMANMMSMYPGSAQAPAMAVQAVSNHVTQLQQQDQAREAREKQISQQQQQQVQQSMQSMQELGMKRGRPEDMYTAATSPSGSSGVPAMGDGGRASPSKRRDTGENKSFSASPSRPGTAHGSPPAMDSPFPGQQSPSISQGIGMGPGNIGNIGNPRMGMAASSAGSPPATTAAASLSSMMPPPASQPGAGGMNETQMRMRQMQQMQARQNQMSPPGPGQQSQGGQQLSQQQQMAAMIGGVMGGSDVGGVSGSQQQMGGGGGSSSNMSINNAAMQAMQIIQNPNHPVTQYLHRTVPSFATLPLQDQVRRVFMLQAMQQKQQQQQQQQQQMLAAGSSGPVPGSINMQNGAPNMTQSYPFAGFPGQTSSGGPQTASTSAPAINPMFASGSNMMSAGIGPNAGMIPGMADLSRLNPQQRQFYLLQQQQMIQQGGSNQNFASLQEKLRQATHQQQAAARQGSPSNMTGMSTSESAMGMGMGITRPGSTVQGMSRDGRSPSGSLNAPMTGRMAPSSLPGGGQMQGQMPGTNSDYQRLLVAQQQAAARQAYLAQQQQQQQQNAAAMWGHQGGVAGSPSGMSPPNSASGMGGMGFPGAHSPVVGPQSWGYSAPSPAASMHASEHAPTPTATHVSPPADMGDAFSWPPQP